MSTRMNWRLASRLSVITFAILAIIIVAVIQQYTAKTSGSSGSSSTNTSGLQGTDLGGSTAPNFHLTDQNGKQVSLTQFKGTPVVLTFLYTHCPDVCPLTAEHLHSTMLNLGKDAHNVTVLAISTDPQNDTIEAANTFSQAHNMQNYWHFLMGTQSQLAPVWSSYSIFAQVQQHTVNHSSAIYLIDKQGHERVFLDGTASTPSQIAADLKILLSEKSA